MTDTLLPSIATSLPFIAITNKNFPEFQRQVYDHAASVCLDNRFLIHRHGLLSFVTTIETWQQLPGNAVVDGDNIVFLPRDTLTPPVPPADNANAWRLFDYRTKEFDKVATGVLHLTRRLKDALPAADRNELSDPTLGMGQIMSLDIMTHLRTQYGTLTSEDYKLLYTQLAQKLDTATNFTGFAADQRFIFEQLAAQGQRVPELQKCDFLRTGTAHLIPIQKAIDFYLTAHPRTATQTFASMVEHITLHAPNFIQTTTDMGYTAASADIRPHPASDISALLASPLFVTALATAAAAAVIPLAVRRTRNRGGRSTQSSVPTVPPVPPRSYCFAHGYDSHTGVDCHKIRYGPLAKDFTEAARQALHHTAVQGGSTHRL